MSETDAKTVKARGYSQGYAAGRRRALREDREEARRALKEDFTQRMMIAIASQQIREPWGKTVDGVRKNFTTAPEIMGNVRYIAEEAARLCAFYPPTIIDDPAPPSQVTETGR
jgi:hypothetical protein